MGREKEKKGLRHVRVMFGYHRLIFTRSRNGYFSCARWENLSGEVRRKGFLANSVCEIISLGEICDGLGVRAKTQAGENIF